MLTDALKNFIRVNNHPEWPSFIFCYEPARVLGFVEPVKLGNWTCRIVDHEGVEVWNDGRVRLGLEEALYDVKREIAKLYSVPTPQIL